MKKVTHDGNVIGLIPDWDPNYNKKEKALNKYDIITGGKTPPGSLDWLSPLPVGSVFLVESILDVNNFTALRLEVDYKYEQAVSLHDNLNDRPFAIVNPLRFCKLFRKVELLYTPEEEQENGNSDRIEHDPTPAA